MPVRYYKNQDTGEEKQSLKKLKAPWKEVIKAPNHKFMVTANKATGKSKLKDQDKLLRTRSRNYARDVEIDDNIQFNKANGLEGSVRRNLLNSKGEKRRKIDDI